MEPPSGPGGRSAIPDPDVMAATLEATINGIVITDTQGAVQWVNQAFCHITGYDFDEALGMSLGALLGSEPRGGEAFEHIQKVIFSGQAWHGELLNRRKDGALFLADLTITPVRDPKGGSNRFIVIQHDLTERRQREDALRQSEERFRLAFRTSPDAINLTRLSDGTFVDINDGFCVATGYSREEVIGKTSPDLRLWADSGDRARLLAGLTESGSVRDMEVRFRFKDGRIRTGLLSAAIFLLGEEPHILTMVRDIEDRKQAEAALRQSEALYRALLEASPDLICLIDPEGHILYLSPRARELFRLEDEAAGVGTFILNWVAPEDQGHVLLMHQNLLRGEPLSGSRVCHMVRADGSRFRGEFDPAVVPSLDGRPRAIVAIIRDVTERQRSEEALRESQTRLAQAQRMARLGHWEVDCATWRAEWSEETSRIFGVTSRSGRIGRKTYFARIHPDDRDAVWSVLKSALSTGRLFDLDYRIVLPDGTQRHVREHAEVIRDEAGKPPRMLGTIQDVTEFKELEEQFHQAQKMEAIGLLAGGVAHDFNNMLAVIVGQTKLMLSELPAGHPQRGRAEEVLRAAERNADLTRQLLAFSRRQVLQPRVLDLNALVAEMARMLRRLIGEHIELRTELSEQLGQVRADPTQIEQILMNLVVNARDAMPKGGTLTIRTVGVAPEAAPVRGSVRPGTFVMLEVSDTGHGMDTATRQRIFEPFFSTKEFGQGSGLGLSTVYGIVEQSGGHIEVLSDPGQGASFRIYLPAVDELPAVVPAPEAAPAPTGRETVLLVEDEPGVRLLIVDVLQGLGYTVLEAEDGLAGIQRLQQHTGPVDLLVADVVMPRMGGEELASRLSILRPGLKVLFISGHPQDSAGMQPGLFLEADFLAKPFSPDQLGKTVREILDRAPASRAN